MEEKDILKEFLNNITVDATIRNLGDLYQKYIKEAEKLDLEDEFGEYRKDRKDRKDQEIGFHFSLRIDLPSDIPTRSNNENVHVDFEYPRNWNNGEKLDYESLPFHPNRACRVAYYTPYTFFKQGSSGTSTTQTGCEFTIDAVKIDEEKDAGNVGEEEKRFINSVYDKSIQGKPLIRKLYYGCFAVDWADNGQEGLSRCFVMSDNADDFIFRAENVTARIREDIIEKVRKLSSSIRNKHIKNLMRFVKKETVKSAVSAIMSRNMSHNLGSHYLYYTKNQLAALADKFDKEGPEIRGAANVLGYVQARMDYLSTIVAGDKYPYGGVFFKGQIFDELTIDDFSIRHFKKNEKDEVGRDKMFKRTTNYLLQNLILSENFTRGPVIDGQESLLKDGNKLIKLQIRYNDVINDMTFTGDPGKNENKAKQMFSKKSIALPGGIMSVHAFFNVVENLIRNAAKYKKGDLKDELVVTIGIKEVPKEDNKPYLYEFVVYDNKENALTADGGVTLLEQMNNQLKGLQILDEKNGLEKSSKGIKEMLFSTLWMRAYSYEKEESLADVITDIDNKKGEDKFNVIRNHAFEYVAVDDNGNVVADNDTVMENRFSEANLGIRFQLPEFRMMELVEKDSLTRDLIEKGLNNFTDIICVHEKPTDEMKKCFTRIYYDESKVVNKENENEASNAAKAMKFVLDERFGSIDEFKLIIGGKGEDGCEISDSEPQSKGVFFRTHLGNNMNEDLTTMEKYYYSDSISGGDFTKTLENLFHKGLDRNGRYLSDEDEYFGLKIKESALTRITLIDERFFKNMNEVPNQDEILRFKNIRLLNLKASCPSEGKDAKSLFDGNCFRDGKDCTHFLSIHLGMIEKIVGDDDWSKAFRIDEDDTIDEEQINNKIKKIIKDDEGDMVENRKIRAVKLMYRLREMFKTEKGEVFISVHSGRGNFSKELEGPLKEYPFISVSALESVLNDSKFLLAQLFYNTVYIGKGVLNN